MRILSESVFFKNMGANVIAKASVAREFSYEISKVSEKRELESEFYSEKKSTEKSTFNLTWNKFVGSEGTFQVRFLQYYVVYYIYPPIYRSVTGSLVVPILEWRSGGLNCTDDSRKSSKSYYNLVFRKIFMSFRIEVLN